MLPSRFAMQLPSVRVALAGAGSLILLLVLFSFGHSHLSQAQSDSLHHVFNDTLGFEKIFVISFASRSDQRDRLSLAAALSGLEVEYIDGVTDLNPKAMPLGAQPTDTNHGLLGAWRAHMNALRTIVERNISSALIMEGDVDWDVRIKSQMVDFAKSSRLLLQPGQAERHMDVRDYAAAMGGAKVSSSPYGDDWDMLWLGHCGAYFPTTEQTLPTGRITVQDDQTVAEPQHFDTEYGGDDLIKEYPPHTRVVSWARLNVCSLAYGITQAGARRFLYDIGIRQVTAATDIMYRQMCDGLAGRPRHKCITVRPQLFQHHRPVAKKSTFSEISDHGDDMNEHAFTTNIRWSTMMNLPQLMYGRTDYIDLFEDGKPLPDYLAKDD